MKHVKLLRAFHAVCAGAGMTTDERRTLVASFGVDSSTDLTEGQLQRAIGMVNGGSEGDKWRKRVIKAIGAYLTAEGREAGLVNIKGVACQATGYDRFNDIPVQRLQNIYNAFLNKKKDSQQVKNLSGNTAWVLVGQKGKTPTMPC